MPQTVAQGKAGIVRRVFHVRKIVLQQVLLDLCARDAEHRADDLPALWRNAAQTAQRRASDEVQKNGFQIVVLCVCRCNNAFERGKKTIAQDPRRLLHALAGFLAACQHIGVRNRERNGKAFAKRPDKRLVAVGFLPAQLMVEVRGFHGDGKLFLKRAHHMQQAHRVLSAGDGAHERASGLDQLVFPDESQNVTPHASTPDRRTWCTAASIAS